MQLAYVHLPYEFTFLLQQSMQTTGIGYSTLKKEFWDTKSFSLLLNIICSDLGGVPSFERVLTSLGWLGLRDRLAYLYLHHKKCGYFPDQIEKSYQKSISDLLSFEERLSEYTVNGMSRGYLLSFYWKMILTQRENQKNLGHSQNVSGNLVSPELFDLLKHVKTKIVAIDWVVLILMHSLEYLGKETTLRNILDGGSFKSLFYYFNSHQKYDFCSNMLSYGASIGEREAFWNPTV